MKKHLFTILLLLLCSANTFANCSATASISGNKSVCQNSTNSYIGGFNKFYTYKWTVTGGTILSGANSDTVTIAWSSSGKGVVKLVASDGPCKDSTTDTITVNAAPSANAGIDDSVCYGDSVQIGMKAVAGDVYSWTSYSGTTFSISNPWASPFHDNHYYLKVKDTLTGCLNYDTVNIKVNPIPSRPSFASSNTPCVGDTLYFTSGTVSGATYAWKGDNGYTASTQNPFIPSATMADTGFYGVRVTVNGCTSAYRYTFVYVHSDPVPNISGGLNACANTSKSFTANTATTYSWTATGGTISSGGSSSSANISWGSAGKGSLTLMETNSNGCKGSVTDTVIINSLPKVNPGTDDSVCYGDSVQIGAAAVSGMLYSWTSISGSTYKVSNPYVSPFKNNRYYLKVTDTTTGCSNVDSVNIKVNQLPSRPSTVSNNGPLCVGDALKLSCATVVGATYSWLGDNGYTSTTQNPTISNVTLKDTGFYGIRAVVSGCYSAFRYTFVHIYPKPTPSITGNSSVCAGSSQTYSAGTSTNTYKWKASGGTVSSTSKNSATISWGSGLGGIVTLIETNSNGCSDSTMDTISIIAVPIANAGVNDSICPGKNASIGVTSISGYTYSWSSSPSGYSNTSSSGSVSPSSTTIYYVVVTDGTTGCTARSQVTVKVNLPPTANFDYDLTCFGQNTSFSDSSVGNIKSWNWNFGDASTSTSQNPKHTFGTVDTFDVQLKVTSGSGCTDSIEKTLRIFPATTAKFKSVLGGGRTVHFTPDDTLALSYAWNLGDGSRSTQIKPSETYITDAEYYISLTVTNGKGCSVQYDDSVDVIYTGINEMSGENLSIGIYPNPFNDHLNIEYTLDKSTKVNIAIYSVDGKLISTLANTNASEGKHQIHFNPDSNIPAGVYILKMLINDKVITKPIVRVD